MKNSMNAVIKIYQGKTHKIESPKETRNEQANQIVERPESRFE